MEDQSMMYRLKAWWYTPKSLRFHIKLMSLGLILGIGMRWLHQDFLSGFGIGIAIAAGFMAAPRLRQS